MPTLDKSDSGSDGTANNFNYINETNELNRFDSSNHPDVIGDIIDLTPVMVEALMNNHQQYLSKQN
jgi:hypothetical protein